MKRTPPTTTHMGISDTRARLSSVVNDVYNGETRVVVEKSGIRVAVLVSPADFDRWQKDDRQRMEDFAVLDEMRTAFADVSEDALMEQAARDLAEVREEMRAEAKARAEVLARREAKRVMVASPA